MAEIDRLLAPGEILQYLTRKHVSTLYRAAFGVLVGLALAALLGFLIGPEFGENVRDIAAGVVFGFFLVRFFIAALRWSRAEVAVTDRRVIVVAGVLGRQVTIFPLGRIQRVGLRRGAGRLQGYGSIRLDMGAEGAVRLTRIPKPKRMFRLLGELIQGDPATTMVIEPDEGDTGPLPRVRL
ncbi:MAG: PH domain-containing protein [Actinomycetota bacterium]